MILSRCNIRKGDGIVMKNSVRVIFALCFMLCLTVSAAAKPADELIADIYAADSEAKTEIQDVLDANAEQIAAMARSCNPDAPPEIEVTLSALKSDNAMRRYRIQGDFCDAINGGLEQIIISENSWYIPLYEGKIDIYCRYYDDLGKWKEPSVSTGRFDAGYGCMGYEHAAELLAQKGITDIDDMRFVSASLYRFDFMYARAGSTEYMIFLEDVSEFGLEQQKVYALSEVIHLFDTPAEEFLGEAGFAGDRNPAEVELKTYDSAYSSTDIWAIVFVVAAGLALCLGTASIIYKLIKK